MDGGPFGRTFESAIALVRGGAMVMACAVIISACGTSAHSSTIAKNLDMTRVKRAIEQSIMSQRHLKSTVVCPAKVAQQPGKFACIATTRSAKRPHRKIKTPFVVTIHNTKGYVTYVGE